MPAAIVIPTTLWTPTRQALNDVLGQMIAAFMAAVPGVTRKWWSEIPETFNGEAPLVYLGDIAEKTDFSAGLRQTLYTGFIGYVDHSADNQEANTRANTFVDYMRELFTANIHAVSDQGVLAPAGIHDGLPVPGPIHKMQHLNQDYVLQMYEGRS